MENETIEVSESSMNRIALSQYIGYTCTECGHEFESIEDIKNKNPVCSGKDKSGIKLACKKCFNNITKEDKTQDGK